MYFASNYAYFSKMSLHILFSYFKSVCKVFTFTAAAEKNIDFFHSDVTRPTSLDSSIDLYLCHK